MISSVADYRALIDSCGRDVPDPFGGPARRGIDYERLPADALFISDAALKDDSRARHGEWDVKRGEFTADVNADRYEDPGMWDLTSGVVLNRRAVTVTVVPPPSTSRK